MSAVILNRPREYDQALESFSKPLMERVEYTMDDRIADLFVRLVRQNGGTLSKKKRALPEFAVLTSDEIAAMEAVMRDVKQ